MKKLFLSFTALVYAVADGRITEADLADGLFYFGCSRELLFNDRGARRPHIVHYENTRAVVADGDGDGVKNAIAQIQAALLTAEAAGRVRWRPRDRRNSFGELEELLRQNRFGPLPERTSDEQMGYSYTGAQDLLARSGLPIEGFVR